MPLEWVESRGVHTAFVGTLGVLTVGPREVYGPDKRLFVRVFESLLPDEVPDLEAGKERAVAAAREALTAAHLELSH